MTKSFETHYVCHNFLIYFFFKKCLKIFKKSITCGLRKNRIFERKVIRIKFSIYLYKFEICKTLRLVLCKTWLYLFFIEATSSEFFVSLAIDNDGLVGRIPLPLPLVFLLWVIYFTLEFRVFERHVSWIGQSLSLNCTHLILHDDFYFKKWGYRCFEQTSQPAHFWCGCIGASKLI